MMANRAAPSTIPAATSMEERRLLTGDGFHGGFTDFADTDGSGQGGDGGGHGGACLTEGGTRGGLENHSS